MKVVNKPQKMVRHFSAPDALSSTTHLSFLANYAERHYFHKIYPLGLVNKNLEQSHQAQCFKV